MQPSAHKRLATLTVIAASVALLACGDRRVRDLRVGMPRDSVLITLGSAPPDSEAFIFDRDQYIVDGKNIEVFYYDPKSRMAFVDTVPSEELTPVVLLSGKATGWGWGYWDSVAASIRVQQPHKDTTRSR
ncbi:MAG: hypothetical protein ACT4P6_09590 [Gemmatimonadaceae bacterium]